MDFGRQVGVENRAKIAQKRHRKNDEKMKRNKMAKKSQQDAPTTRGGGGPEPWGGGRGRGNPLLMYDLPIPTLLAPHSWRADPIVRQTGPAPERRALLKPPQPRGLLGLLKKVAVHGISMENNAGQVL